MRPNSAVSADRSLPNRVTFTDADMRQVLAAMRRAVPMAETVAVTDAAAACGAAAAALGRRHQPVGVQPGVATSGPPTVGARAISASR